MSKLIFSLGVAAAYVRLRWRLLRGALRHGGSEQVGAVASTAASAIFGIGLGVLAAIVGRTGVDDWLVVVFCTVVLVGVLGFGVVTGVSQPIDPRVLASEPLSDRDRVAGLLAASACGPPGLAGIALGVGMAVGLTRDIDTFPVVVAAVSAWLVSLLLVARTATNVLALLVNHFPRVGQLTVGVFGLAFYGLFQVTPVVISELDPSERIRLADALAWSPSGQLGRAMSPGDAGPGVAHGVAHSAVHLAFGAAWLPILLVGFTASSRRLALSVRRGGGLDVASADSGPLARIVRRACGRGVTGALAWRSLLVRFRTPKTALETFIGGGVGLAAVLVPTLTRDTAGSGAVLVGGAIQLAVLFMSGNSFGSDGPPLTYELVAGVRARELVVAKARSIAIVASPLALVGPLIAASLTGEWRYLGAGLGVGIGALLAGTGAALVQSAVVPIAIPESENPFAGGESGKGIVAAGLLALVVIGLAVLTLPVALALIWATERGDTTLVTLLGIVTIGVGWLAARAGIAIATTRIGRREPEFVTAITPAR